MVWRSQNPASSVYRVKPIHRGVPMILREVLYGRLWLEIQSTYQYRHIWMRNSPWNWSSSLNPSQILLINQDILPRCSRRDFNVKQQRVTQKKKNLYYITFKSAKFQHEHSQKLQNPEESAGMATTFHLQCPPNTAHEPRKKKRPYFPWNTRCFIGILDPCNGLSYSKHNWIVFHPLWTLNYQGSLSEWNPETKVWTAYFPY